MRAVCALVLALFAVAAPAESASTASFAVKSRYVHRTLHEKAAVPEGGGQRPLLLWLHGRGGHPGDIFWPEFHAELKRLGDRAPVVVEVDGGNHSYYHDRRSGRWGSYVMREVLPEALRRFDVDPQRVAIGGISMGGFGALDLARLNPGRFCAAGGHSPAIWLRAADTAPGAFDSAADFRRHDLYRYARTHAHPYGQMPVWIDRGNADPFGSFDAQLVRSLKRRGASVTSRVARGGHTGAYWRAHIARYLRWYAGRLADC